MYKSPTHLSAVSPCDGSVQCFGKEFSGHWSESFRHLQAAAPSWRSFQWDFVYFVGGAVHTLLGEAEKRALLDPRCKTNATVTRVENGFTQNPPQGESMPAQLSGATVVHQLQHVSNRAVAESRAFHHTRFLFLFCQACPIQSEGVCALCWSLNASATIMFKADIIVINRDESGKHAEPPPRERSDVIHLLTSLENSHMRPQRKMEDYNFLWSYHQHLRLHTSYAIMMHMSYGYSTIAARSRFEDKFTVSSCHIWKIEVYQRTDEDCLCGTVRERATTTLWQAKHWQHRTEAQVGIQGIELLSNYKFALAIENFFSTEHVSENFSGRCRHGITGTSTQQTCACFCPFPERALELRS